MLLGILITLFLARHMTDSVFAEKTSHGIMQAKAFYYQPKNSIDVLMMGSSHTHCNINTALLWEEYGIAAYDYSAVEQPLWITYYYLKEALKTQQPKLVVLDLYSPARFKGDYQYMWLDDNVLGVRPSLNKLRMLSVAAERKRFFGFFPSFVVNHARYNKVVKEDWKAFFPDRAELEAFKGYTPYFGEYAMEEPELDQAASGGLTEKSETYLQKIIDLCRKEKIELFLIVAPYNTTSEDELVYNRVKDIAEEQGIEFHSSNYYYDQMELDFKTDFADDSHLNYEGSCKFTCYLGQELQDRYTLPDHRGEAAYESWDRHAETIRQRVESVYGTG